MMDVRPLRSENDLAWALKEIEGYFDRPPVPGSLDADRFDVLSTLVESYEATHHPIEDSDPVDVLCYAIEAMGRSQAELADLLGSRPRASEILRRKRHLTLEQIRIISEAWALPVSALIKPYRLAQDAA